MEGLFMRYIMYDREAAINYAKKWAYERNPLYYDFSNIGGDCTNFISQCIYAGVGVMNYTPVLGWYYRSANDRTPSWTAARYLADFLLNNKSIGPYGHLVALNEIEKGDIIQLGNFDMEFYHSLIVTETKPQILVATHSFNAFDRPLTTYDYDIARCIKIDGARGWQ